MISYFRGLLLSLCLTYSCTAFNSGIYSLNPTRKDIAVDILKNMQSENKSEFQKAQMWCKTHESDDNYAVSFVCDNSNTNSIDYIVMYRQKKEVFTVSGLVRLQPATSLSSAGLFLLLRKWCDAKGYLQLHELKTWCSGRYPTESRLEHVFQVVV